MARKVNVAIPRKGGKSNMDELYPSTHFRKYTKSVNTGSFKKKSLRVEALWVSKNVPVGLFDDMGGREWMKRK